MKKKEIDKIDLLHVKIESLQKSIRRLNQEKEDLKCCGNCVWGVFELDFNPCKMKIKTTDPGGYCDTWHSDDLKSKERLDYVNS